MVLFLLSFFIITENAHATSGACSYHNGVNCSAGYDIDGSVICKDGWKDSSVLFDDNGECENYFGCNSTQYEEVVNKTNFDSEKERILNLIEQKNKELSLKKSQFDSLGSSNVYFGRAALEKRQLAVYIQGVANEIITLQQNYNNLVSLVNSMCEVYGRQNLAQLRLDATLRYSRYLDEQRELRASENLKIILNQKVVNTETSPDVKNNILQNDSKICQPDNKETLIQCLGVSINSDLENYYKKLVLRDINEFKVVFNNNQLESLKNFVVYGISSETIIMGEGERRSLLRDYLETVGKSDVYWQDVQNLATGKLIISRNLEKEKSKAQESLKYFKKVFGVNPDFKNKKHELFWNTLMYRIRFTRDTEKEKSGIDKFKKIFNRSPRNTLDWATVRGLSYIN